MMNILKKLHYYFFSFSGRAGRLEYSIYFIFNLLCTFYILELHANTNWNDKTILNLFYIYIIVLISFIPIQAATTRRLRDLNLNTGWIIINLIPTVNLVFSIILLIVKGKNRK